jgi:23S rRNA maturation mini-RNase III
MGKSRRRAALPLPLMMADLAFASWETMLRRTMMMAQGNCSPAEYQRMVLEKAQAAQASMLALMLPRRAADMSAIVAPWHRRARANAKRLRRK